MPGGACFSRQAETVNIRPGCDELPIKSLPVETGTAPFGGFNELRKEWPHRKTVIESDGGRLTVSGHTQSDAYISTAISDRSDQFWRDIMGVYIDRHGCSLDCPVELLRRRPWFLTLLNNTYHNQKSGGAMPSINGLKRQMRSRGNDSKGVIGVLRFHAADIVSVSIAIAEPSPVRHDLSVRRCILLSFRSLHIF
jgi:hypothetical protein